MTPSKTPLTDGLQYSRLVTLAPACPPKGRDAAPPASLICGAERRRAARSKPSLTRACSKIASLLLLLTALAPAADFDLLIRNARIADGTGGPLRPGSIAIKADRIAALGEIAGTATTEIDAAGQIAAPGFIDVHTHSERIPKLPSAENFVRMGVTTIVTGNCGGSHLDVAKFFRELSDVKVAINVATLIGHNTVRQKAMGGNLLREPTPAELETMKQLVDQAMRDGAVGLSTGLIYVPGTFAKTEEIIELARVAAAHDGIYASHMRYETTRIFTALDELFRIAREARIRAEVSHLKLSGPSAWGKADQVLAALEKARAEGLAITHDAYAYTASSTGLEQLIPDKARAGTRADFAARLADPAQKAAIVKEMTEMRERQGRSDYAYAVIAKYDGDHSLTGKNIAQAAKLKRGSDSVEDQMELLFEIYQKGGGSGVFHGMSEPDLQKFLAHPLTMIASDGGPRVFGEDVPHPRSYGNNARVLGRYVRELHVLTLEDAIRKMTSLPAATFHLADRGTLEPGAFADLVVFDPEKISDPATFEDPHHYAVGLTHVIVNGGLVLQNGELTETRSGVPIRMSPRQ